MSTPKIVRKVYKPKVITDATHTAFWLDGRRLRCWWEGPCRLPAEDVVNAGTVNWTANDRDAAACGTTLDAIRAELLASGPVRRSGAYFATPPIETPAPDAHVRDAVAVDNTTPASPPTQYDQLERLALQKFAGLMMACANAGTDGGYIQDTAVELGLMVPTICDESCEYCCGEPGEDTCYRPRYAEDGTPVGEVGG